MSKYQYIIVGGELCHRLGRAALKTPKDITKIRNWFGAEFIGSAGKSGFPDRIIYKGKIYNLHSKQSGIGYSGAGLGMAKYIHSNDVINVLWDKDYNLYKVY